MNIVIRVSEVREVSSCYHVKMGNISWVAAYVRDLAFGI